RPVHNTAVLAKWDWKVTPTSQASLSYNFNRSNKLNDTFDVPTYGNSANGNEGPSRIQVANFNLYSTISPTMLNEAHFTYSRENRPRAAAASNVAADTAMGFATTFRFGNPYFIQPGIDEIFWRTQVKDNISVVSANHTIKAGGEWVHSRNVQVFRGFFTGRYIFDSVTGFLRYASSPALGPGYGPRASGCPDGSYVDAAAPCPGGATKTGGPLLFYSQGAGLDGPATDAAGASDFANDEFALFAQDKWQARSNLTLNYGLRWEAQILPKPFISPALTAYGQFIGDPRFPSTGYLPSQRKMFQPRIGFAWDIFKNSRSVLRANWGIYNARQNMLSQVGSLTTNGVQQQSIFVNTTIIGFGVTPPVWPNVVSPPPVPPGTFPAGSGVRVFSRDYANPRVYTANVAYEQELFGGLVAYLDATWSKGVHLTRFINVNNGSGPAVVPQEGNTVIYTGPPPFGPQLGEVMVASSSAKSLYRGFTAGARRRFSRGFQLEGNYVWSKDLDDDSNERDPFTDRSFNRFDFSKDYAYSDRDIRHKFNFYAYAELPLGLQASARIQARSAQPITPTPRVFNGFDRGRNSTRKDNEYFSFDWRVQRPVRFGDRFALIPVVEMFNTTNSKNNINPLVTPALFNFDGYLRQGVGDPRQLQLAVKFTF
ncbi:MAG TPA: TonB-dependent receptor, partial [Blastocatellia bacterium]|nr:TonB-dependent receptor [Blastocatellia bacterium]